MSRIFAQRLIRPWSSVMAVVIFSLMVADFLMDNVVSGGLLVPGVMACTVPVMRQMNDRRLNDNPDPAVSLMMIMVGLQRQADKQYQQG